MTGKLMLKSLAQSKINPATGMLSFILLDSLIAQSLAEEEGDYILEYEGKRYRAGIIDDPDRLLQYPNEVVVKIFVVAGFDGDIPVLPRQCNAFLPDPPMHQIVSYKIVTEKEQQYASIESIVTLS